MIIDGNKLTPEEGYKYITNGDVWSEIAYLGIHDSPSNWHDTNEDPPEPPEPEEDASEEDYQEQLRRYGAEV